MPDPLSAHILRRLRFADGLPEPALARLAEISVLRAFRAGDILFREGAAEHNLFFVITGNVALDMFVPGRGAVRMLTIGSGEVLGWSAVIGGGVMTATATAIDDGQLVSIAASELRSLCDSDHELGYQVMQRMAVALSKRLVATRLQLLDLFSPVAAHTAAAGLPPAASPAASSALAGSLQERNPPA